jgi:hypothetical protein
MSKYEIERLKLEQLATMEREPEVAGEGEDECPGAGKCHGCMCWCDRCGDVTAVCDGEGHCDQHCCISCRMLLTSDEQDESYGRDEGLWKWCQSCHRALERDAEIKALESAMELTGC